MDRNAVRRYRLDQRFRGRVDRGQQHADASSPTVHSKLLARGRFRDPPISPGIRQVTASRRPRRRRARATIRASPARLVAVNASPRIAAEASIPATGVARKSSEEVIAGSERAIATMPSTVSVVATGPAENQEPEQRGGPANRLAPFDDEAQQRGHQRGREKLPGRELERALPPYVVPHMEDRDRPHHRARDEQEVAVDHVAPGPVEADRVEQDDEPADTEREPGCLEPGQALAEQQDRRRRHPERGDEREQRCPAGLRRIRGPSRSSRGRSPS